MLKGRGANRRRIRIFSVSSLLLLGASVLLVVIEIVVALRREYFVEGPADRIEGSFGDGSSPALKLVVLGDSTSVGVGTTPSEAYPVVLSQILSDEFRVDLSVLGRSGDRVGDLRRDQLPEAIGMNPDMVVICVGANDATHATPLRRVRSDMSAILDALAEARIETVVVGPPDMGAKAFAQPLRMLSRWNGRRVGRAIRTEARRRGMDFVPLADLTGPLFAQDPDAYFSKDGFHPSGEGYRLWVDAMLPVVSKAAVRAAQSG